MEMLPIPKDVAKEARIGLELLRANFDGGTETGWRRAQQLANDKEISVKDVAVMRAWFARHGPDALHKADRNVCAPSQTGTSYPGYLAWVRQGRPMTSSERHHHRGAVAWLIWGGDAAYRWLKTEPVRRALKKYFPNRATADHCDRLVQLNLV